MNAEYNENQPSHHLHARLQIGSVKGPISYKPFQTVFHQDDIPPERRTRKNEVTKWLSNKLLSTDPPSWNKSIEIIKKPWDKRRSGIPPNDRSNAFQYNFRSEVLPPQLVPPIDKPTKFHVSTQLNSEVIELEQKMRADPIYAGIFRRTEELPNHPKLSNAVPWNPSTELLPSDKNSLLEELNKKSKQHSSRKKAALKPSTGYVNPEKISAQIS